MNSLHSRTSPGGGQRHLARLAGVTASATTLTLVTWLFWNASRHTVDAPNYKAQMQQCQALPGAGARRQCVDDTFARAIASQGDRLFAEAAAR